MSVSIRQMSKSSEYLEAAGRCWAKASQSRANEHRQLWLTIGETYRYLAEIEQRDAALMHGLLEGNNHLG